QCIFFFSSRRRHTRFSRDWSSDVYSSDLPQWPATVGGASWLTIRVWEGRVRPGDLDSRPPPTRNRVVMEPLDLTGLKTYPLASRSEERRVGKEGRWRRSE